MSIEKAHKNLSINALLNIAKLASKGVYTGFDLEEDRQ
jgi:hypothetical protein